jgi:micrococcal nuclease
MFFENKKLDKALRFIKRNKTNLIISLLFIISLIWWGWDRYKEEIKCYLPKEVLVTKVIDGDTVVVEGGKEIRLLGIDADERNYPCYESAKIFLEKLVLNKKVRLEKDKENVDRYGRCLRYLISDGKNIDFELVKEGEAVCRFQKPNLKYREICEKLEKEAIENKVGCKWKGKVESKKIKVISACKAKKHIGEIVFVEGKVVSTYRSTKDNVFLNFEKPYPNQCFSAVIFNSNLSKFPEKPEEFYQDKKVKVFGEIREYKGKPEIILESQNQIEVLN